MTHRDMTRKEFLGALTAFFGLFLLSRLPFGGNSKQSVPPASGSYGTSTYGGTQ
jgi:hypothetical protein